MSPDRSSRPQTDLRSSKRCLNIVFTNQSDCDHSRRAARRRLTVCWLFFLLKTSRQLLHTALNQHEGGDNDSINLHVQNLPQKHHDFKISYQSNPATVVCSANTNPTKFCLSFLVVVCFKSAASVDSVLL